MSISSLAVLLLVIGGLVGVRVALFKLLKPGVELPSLEAVPRGPEEAFTQTPIWPVMVLIVVIMCLIVGLMLFGNAIGG